VATASAPACFLRCFGQGEDKVLYNIGPRERGPSRRREMKEMDWIIDGWTLMSSLGTPSVPDFLPLCDPGS
jgi:hypothetical protein